MHMIGSICIRSASTRKRSIRLGFRLRLGGAGDDQQLIDVGDENLLPAFAHAAENVLSRLDLLDQRIARRFGAKPNNVARDNDVPQIGAEVLRGPAWRSETARPSSACTTLGQPMHAEHSAAKASATSRKTPKPADFADPPRRRRSFVCGRAPLPLSRSTWNELVLGALVVREISASGPIAPANRWYLAEFVRIFFLVGPWGHCMHRCPAARRAFRDNGTAKCQYRVLSTRVTGGQDDDDYPNVNRPANASAAAAIVASMSASVWAAETNSASYWLHGM